MSGQRVGQTVQRHPNRRKVERWKSEEISIHTNTNTNTNTKLSKTDMSHEQEQKYGWVAWRESEIRHRD
jgi:hypothetical protein